MSGGGPGGRDPLVIGHRILALGPVVSTQAEISRLAAAGAPEGTVVTAEHQSGGRGRQGRAWWDQPGESLMLSVLLRPPIALPQAPPLCLVAALAVVDALRTAAGIVAGIRWPNDVLVNGRKLCGILAEAGSTSDGGVDHVVLGIGINVNQTAFPEEIAEQATSVRLLTGREQDRGRLLEILLAALQRRYRQFLDGGFAALRAECRRSSVTIGQRIRMPEGLAAEAVDVDEDGALLVRTEAGGVARIVSGEVGSAPAP